MAGLTTKEKDSLIRVFTEWQKDGKEIYKNAPKDRRKRHKHIIDEFYKWFTEVQNNGHSNLTTEVIDAFKKVYPTQDPNKKPEVGKLIRDEVLNFGLAPSPNQTPNHPNSDHPPELEPSLNIQALTDKDKQLLTRTFNAWINSAKGKEILKAAPSKREEKAKYLADQFLTWRETHGNKILNDLFAEKPEYAVRFIGKTAFEQISKSQHRRKEPDAPPREDTGTPGTFTPPRNESLVRQLNPAAQNAYMNLRNAAIQVAAENPTINHEVNTRFLEKYLVAAVSDQNQGAGILHQAQVKRTPQHLAMQAVRQNSARNQQNLLIGFEQTTHGDQAWEAMKQKMQQQRGGIGSMGAGNWLGGLGAAAAAFFGLGGFGNFLTSAVGAIAAFLFGSWAGGKMQGWLGSLVGPAKPAPQAPGLGMAPSKQHGIEQVKSTPSPHDVAIHDHITPGLAGAPPAANMQVGRLSPKGAGV